VPNTKQEQDFMSTVLNGGLLENAIEWIGNNLNPEDVYSESDLKSWAKGSLDPNDVYTPRDMIDAVARSLSPGDVFSESDLEQWAVENGWVKFF
jgi:hypothetical protein